MKTTFLLVIFLIISGCAYKNNMSRTSLDQDEVRVVFIDVHDKNKDAAFVLAHAWVAKNYRSAKDVIQMADKDAGILIVKSVIPYIMTMGDLVYTSSIPMYLNYTLSIQVKDAKIKMEFDTSSTEGSYVSRDELNIVNKYSLIHTGLLASVIGKSNDF